MRPIPFTRDLLVLPDPAVAVGRSVDVGVPVFWDTRREVLELPRATPAMGVICALPVSVTEEKRRRDAILLARE